MHAGEPGLADPGEVAPWVYAIEQFWDDPAFEAKHRGRALQEATRWNRHDLAERYEQFFSRLTAEVNSPADWPVPQHARFTDELVGLSS